MIHLKQGHNECAPCTLASIAGWDKDDMIRYLLADTREYRTRVRYEA